MSAEREALEHVRTRLGLDRGRLLDQALPGPPGAHPDLVVETDQGTYVVELKRGRADLQAVAQLCFYRDVLTRARGLAPARVRIVLAAKNIPAAVREALEAVDGTALDLPANLPMGEPEPPKPTGKTQLTTPKAWRVAFALLAGGPASVRQLSLRAGVSYGWAHRTVQTLEERGIAQRKGGQIVLADRAKLLNGVAWERPLRSLRAAELKTGFESVEQGARELTRVLGRSEQKFAFTAHTAAALYAGYSFRADRFYLYASDPDVLPDLVGEGQGPTLEVLRPDRELGPTETREGMRLASKAVVLLDLAGMGPGAADVTRTMVEHLA